MQAETKPVSLASWKVLAAWMRSYLGSGGVEAEARLRTESRAGWGGGSGGFAGKGKEMGSSQMNGMGAEPNATGWHHPSAVQAQLRVTLGESL